MPLLGNGPGVKAMVRRPGWVTGAALSWTLAGVQGDQRPKTSMPAARYLVVALPVMGRWPAASL